EPPDVMKDLIAARELCWVTDGGCVRQFPDDVVGDQRLPFPMIVDQCPNMSLQKLSRDAHPNPPPDCRHSGKCRRVDMDSARCPTLLDACSRNFGAQHPPFRALCGTVV